jgi:hypothetical protein
MEDHQKLVLNMARSYLKNNDEKYEVSDKEVFEILREEFPDRAINLIDIEKEQLILSLQKKNLDLQDACIKARAWFNDFKAMEIVDSYEPILKLLNKVLE